MAGRTIAIGDIHGCNNALKSLLDLIEPASDDTIVQLGDIVDRGPQASMAVETLLQLSDICRVVIIRGDHEELMLAALKEKAKLPRWLKNGGVETLKSYGWTKGGPRHAVAYCVPGAHQSLLRSAVDYFETNTHIFVHAGYVADLPMEDQPGLALRWRVLDEQTAEQHCSGKTVIAGHTAQRSGNVLDLGFAKCIDTNCVRGGWLTAIDADTDRVYQVDKKGRLRTT